MRAWIWMKCCVSTDVGTWTNWLTFEPDPDNSPDAGTGLLSSISYVLQRGILLRRENPTYMCIGRPLLQRRVVLRWFYSPRAVETTLSEVYMRSTESNSSFVIWWAQRLRPAPQFLLCFALLIGIGDRDSNILYGKCGICGLVYVQCCG